MKIENFNKKRVIDCIWQSRMPSEVKMSVRESITKKIFNPINRHAADICRIIIDSETEEEALMSIVDLYKENDEFKLSIDTSIESAVKGYYEVLSRYTGLNSVIAWVLMTGDYPSRFDDIRNELFRWYMDKRKQDEMIMACGVIWNAFDINGMLSNVFIGIATHLTIKLGEKITKRINNKVQNGLFSILKKQKTQVLEENKKVPNYTLLSYLYAFELTEEEINEFEKLIISRLYNLLKHIDYDEQVLFIKYLQEGRFTMNEKKKEFDNFLLAIEVDNQKIEYVIDPVIKNIL